MKKRRRKFQFKISQKLAAACMGLCIAVITILTIQYYSYSRRVMESQTQQYINDMLVQTGYNLDLLMGDVETLIFNIQKEPNVQNYLSQLTKNRNNSYAGYLAREELRNTIYKYILFDDNIQSVVFVPESGVPEIISKTIKDYPVNRIQKNKIYDAGGSAVWLGVNSAERYITVAAQINSIKTMRPLGYMMVHVSERKFSEVLNGLGFVKDGKIFIVNQDGIIVSGNNLELLNTRLNDTYQKVVAQKSARIFDIVQNHQEEYVTNHTLSNRSWNLMAVIPVISYQNIFVELKQYFALVFAIAILVSAGVSILYTLSFSDPIKKLLKTMQDFGNGDLNVISSVTSSDEIGLLSQNFNMMVYNINDLIDKVYTETMLKQEAELKSLRMQINPHFLYNTLDTINWLSREKGVPEVGAMAKSLGDMMYYTINGSDFTNVEEEIKNINNYLMIQRKRYEERIVFTVDIPEEMFPYKLPKLILQPLIENAIIHGLDNKTKGGMVNISGRIKNKMLILSVSDNGVGMTQAKVRSILLKESNESIGVRNVNQRLKLYFGEQRGLEIQSIINVGTQVTITIPADD
ncbi:MAG: sensor histidine kinase [Paenibacillaceae bacterium]|nr:sensor histidine kinase [Paenibacillaceae bacterium]